MKLSDFDYDLPKNLIAQKPKKPRDHCRLLVINRHCEERPQGATKQSYFEHLKFFEIEKFLQKGDVIVLNNSKVIPARILGRKEQVMSSLNFPRPRKIEAGGKIEILLIKKLSNNIWEAMLKNFKVKELGKEIIISENFLVTPIKNIGEGLWRIKFNLKGEALDKAIYKYGETPLPPYIKKMAKLSDYQTIYAQKEGSVAAPTAGLHFTKRLINKLKKKGVIFETITLHIGLGTFSPIREENIEKHKMHSEFAEISAKTAKAINKAKSESRRVIAVGTTSMRTLEAFVYSTHNLQQTTNNKNQESKKTLNSGAKDVDIFIKPGYKFKIVDGMITNFHLPETTLMILVSAFAGREKILRAYNEAIKKKYKFFSFGDTMLII